MAKQKAFKKEKYQEGLIKEINLIFRSEIKDSRLTFVSITKVELNSDYSVAKVYWDTFDSSRKNEVSSSLNNVGGKMRSQLSKVLKIRQVPIISFVYDSQFEDELKIDQLLSGDQD